MKSKISVWFGIFGIVTSLNIIFINRSFSQIDSINVNMSSFVDRAIDVQSRIERSEADIALIERSMRQATFNIHKKFIPKQESLYKEHTSEWKKFFFELVLLPAKQNINKNIRNEILLLVAEKISVSARILLQSEKLESDMRAELEAVNDFQPGLKKATYELQKLLDEKSKLWTDAKQKGLLPDVEVDPTDGSFTIKSPTRTKQTPVVETDRDSTFMNACKTNEAFMKGASDNEKASVCGCIVSKLPRTGEALSTEFVAKTRDMCVALSKPFPAAIGAWRITKSSSGLPIAATTFEKNSAIHGVAGTFSALQASCTDGAISLRVHGAINGRRGMKSDDLGHGSKPLIVFNFDENGVFDKKSSQSLVSEMIKSEQFASRNRVYKNIKYPIQNIETKLFYKNNKIDAMDMGSEEIYVDKVGEMVSFLKKSCGI